MSIAGGAVSVILAVCCGIAARPALGILVGFILLCITVPTPVIWSYLCKEKVEERLAARRRELALAEDRLNEIDLELEKAEGKLSSIGSKWDSEYALYRQLAHLDSLKREYWKARHEYDEIQKAAASEQWRLLHTDWRSLRGIDFEDFLQRVFEALGYGVQTTRKTGDQGIDLILTAPGRRIGIQAKGYSDNVGNSSVQEAFTGKAFYGCDACAVITNSDFTAAAREVASRVGCTLINGSQIPDLIAGNTRL
jgi:hypothetical protein